jgi:hypothetical protein
MPQNVVQNSDNLFLEDVIVYYATYSTSLTNDSLSSITGASWNNIGSLLEFSRESAIETATPESFNVEHDQVITRENENINMTIQEIDYDTYQVLSGSIAQQQTVAGSTTDETYVIAANGIAALYDPVQLPQQNYEGNSSTPVAVATSNVSIYVDGSTSTPLTSTSYDIVLLPNGNYALTAISTGWDITLASSVTYVYTPRASNVLWFGGADETTPFMLWVYSIQADGRTLETFYPEVYYVSGGTVTDAAQGTGTYKNVPFGLQAREHKSFTYNGRRQMKIERKST